MKPIALKSLLLLYFFSLYFHSGTASTKKQRPFHLPFKIVNGLMLVEAQMDGTTGSYIIDTGMEMNLINSHHLQQKYAKQSLVNASSGNTIAGHEKKFTLQFNQQEFYISAIMLDLHHLEESINYPIQGVIGVRFLQCYVMTINYSNQVLYFNPINFFGKPLFPSEVGSKPTLEIPMQQKRHMLVAEVEAAGKKWHLGIDTGASINVISRDFQKNARSNFSLHTQEINMVTVDKSRQQYHFFVMHHLKLVGKPLPAMRCSFIDMLALNHELDGCTLHGLLGYESLKHYAIVEVQFQRKKLRLWYHEDVTTKPVLATN